MSAPVNTEYALAKAKFLWWQRWLAGLHLTSALIVAVCAAVNSTRGHAWVIHMQSVYTLWSCGDGGGSTCTQSTYRKQHTGAAINVAFVVMCFSIASGLHHVCMTYEWFTDHVASTGVNTARWADYAVSASLIFLVNSFMYVAHPSLLEVAGVFWVQCLVIAVGYASECLWAASSNLGYRADLWLFLLALLAEVDVFGVLLYSFHQSLSDDANLPPAWPIYGPPAATANSPPWLVYIFVAYVIVSFLAFPVAHIAKIGLWHPQVSERTRNLRYEAVYGVLSFGAKIPLTCLFAVGTLTRGSGASQDTANTAELVAFSTAFTLSLGLGVAMWWGMQHGTKHHSK